VKNGAFESSNSIEPFPVATTLRFLFRIYLVRISPGLPAIMTKVLCSFPQYLQENVGTVSSNRLEPRYYTSIYDEIPVPFFAIQTGLRFVAEVALLKYDNQSLNQYDVEWHMIDILRDTVIYLDQFRDLNSKICEPSF
jgi:hypothetical protein